jgi:hypothetical protein
MPWSKMKDVPPAIQKHKGASLTIEQANKWAQIYDALKGNSTMHDPAAGAWSTWEEIYELKDGAWTTRARVAAESMLYVEEQSFAEGMSDSIVEKDKDGLPSKIRVMVIQEGEARTKRRVYPKEPLQKLAASNMLDNVKMYDQHVEGSEKVPGAIYKARSMRDYLSYIMPGSAKFEEGIKTKAGNLVNGITAVVKLIDRDFKYKVSEAAETMGLSLTGLLEASKGPAGEDIVQNFKRVVSLDWLTGMPNCGGCVLEFVEAAEPGGKEETEMEWKDITADDLKKNRPDLIAGLTSEAQAAQAKAEADKKVSEAQATASKEAEAVAVAESAALKAKLEAKEKEVAEAAAKNEQGAMAAKVIEVVESKCAHLNILGKAQVMKAALGKAYKTDQEIAESVDAAIKLVPSPNGGAGKPVSRPQGEEKEKLPTGTIECAEAMGYSADDLKRLAQARP